jgi:hypothetical protein
MILRERARHARVTSRADPAPERASLSSTSFWVFVGYAVWISESVCLPPTRGQLRARISTGRDRE